MSTAPEVHAPLAGVEVAKPTNKLEQFEQRRATRQLEKYRDDGVACALLQSNILNRARDGFILGLGDYIRGLDGQPEEERMFEEVRLAFRLNSAACTDLLLATLLPVMEDLKALMNNEKIAKKAKPNGK